MQFHRRVSSVSLLKLLPLARRSLAAGGSRQRLLTDERTVLTGNSVCFGRSRSPAAARQIQPRERGWLWATANFSQLDRTHFQEPDCCKLLPRGGICTAEGDWRRRWYQRAQARNSRRHKLPRRGVICVCCSSNVKSDSGISSSNNSPVSNQKVFRKQVL